MMRCISKVTKRIKTRSCWVSIVSTCNTSTQWLYKLYKVALYIAAWFTSERVPPKYNASFHSIIKKYTLVDYGYKLYILLKVLKLVFMKSKRLKKVSKLVFINAIKLKLLNKVLKLVFKIMNVKQVYTQRSVQRYQTFDQGTQIGILEEIE